MGRGIIGSATGDGDDTTLCTSIDEKVCQIEAVLSRSTIDLWQLRELALTEGGLVNDSIRQRAWPALVGLHTAALMGEKVTTDPNQQNTTTTANSRSISLSDDDNNEEEEETDFSSDRRRRRNRIICCDDTQVELDVARCTWHLLTGTQRVQKLQMEHKRNKKIARIIRKKQRRLAGCIKRTLQTASVKLRYYQGYHDIACIFLSTLRDAAPPSAWTLPSSSLTSLSLDLPSAVLLQVSRSHLLDCMQETFQPLQTSLTLSLFPLLALLDPEVHRHLTDCEMAPFFALPWVLTWFSHEIRDTALVKRLFDAFLASHPALPLYVCVAMLLHPYNRAQILETECDFSTLHQTLVGLPKNSSAFGWKYQPGHGYVSDHEDDDDTDSLHSFTSDASLFRSNSSVATASGSGSGPTEGEMVLLQEGLLEKNLHRRMPSSCGGALVEDSVSVTSSLSFMQTTTGSINENVTKVPFQELFDLAVNYMHRIPPRRLLFLAKRFYGTDYVEDLLSTSSSSDCCDNNAVAMDSLPVMLQDPVSWVLSPTAPAEWWLRSRVREMRGLTPRPPRSNSFKRPSAKLPHYAHLRYRKSSKRALIASNSLARTTRMTAKQQSPDDNDNDFQAVPPGEFVKLLRLRRRDCCLAPLASGMALSIPEEKRKRQQERFIGILLSLLILAFAAWQIVWFPVNHNDSTTDSGTTAANKAFQQQTSQDSDHQSATSVTSCSASSSSEEGSTMENEQTIGTSSSANQDETNEATPE
ncbi:hypothetical protein ACA910_011895 [Epithemia clementina (nom. ined.)]